jgi:hypothetical protein
MAGRIPRLFSAVWYAFGRLAHLCSDVCRKTRTTEFGLRKLEGYSVLLG